MTKKLKNKNFFTIELVIPDCPIDDLEPLMNYLSKQNLIFTVQPKIVKKESQVV